MSQTKNLKLVMQVMGHSDVATAVRYQHPGIELVRSAINGRNNAFEKSTAGSTAAFSESNVNNPVSA